MEENTNSGSLIKTSANYWWLSEGDETHILEHMKNNQDISTWGQEIRRFFEIHALPNGMDRSRCKFLIDRVLSIVNKTFSAKKNWDKILMWCFYIILVRDETKLNDQCIVLHAHKRFVMLTFGEPKVLSYVLMLDKGFIQNKIATERSAEYMDNESYTNKIRHEIDQLHQQNKEREELQIDHKSTEMKLEHEAMLLNLQQEMASHEEKLLDVEEKKFELDMQKSSLEERRKQLAQRKEQWKKAQSSGKTNFSSPTPTPAYSHAPQQQPPPSYYYQQQNPPPYS